MTFGWGFVHTTLLVAGYSQGGDYVKGMVVRSIERDGSYRT